MARTSRLDFPGAVHHVCGRGNGKRAIFHDAEDYSCFLRRLALLKDQLEFSVYAYCLMPNHYHLVLKMAEAVLSKVMHRLLTSYARMFNDRWRSVGHPFQGRFKNRLVRDDNDAMGIVRYVHANPVEAQLVTSPDDWAWSGHAALLGKADEIMDAAFVLGLFGGRDEYVEFMRSRPKEALEPLERLADDFGGLAVLRRRSRNTLDAAARREFVGRAIQLGHQQKAVARVLDRTEAAVSMLLRET